MKQTKKLTRSNTNRIFFGVLGGIADYLGWNANVLRVIYILLILISAKVTLGAAVVVYFIIAWIMPAPKNSAFTAFRSFAEQASGATTNNTTPEGRKEIHAVEVDEKDEK
jgi:phage shock protein PspC (stress-responsive transcriptional regulator)